jgi:hypothetical protein
MPKNVSTDRIYSLICCTYSALYAQVNKKRTFTCDFYEVPVIKYSPDTFPKKTFEIDDPNVMVYKGTVDVNFLKSMMCQGSFKTAHPGTIKIQGGTNPFTGGLVCIKQVYECKDGSSTILQLKGQHELELLSMECNCLIWASMLLDLTY